jgi:hypothetical protein
MRVRLCPFTRQPLLSLAWSEPAAGLWVARSEGEFVGMVEASAGCFDASDEAGDVIGRYAGVPDAMSAVDAGARRRISTPAILASVGLVRRSRTPSLQDTALAGTNRLWRK